MRLYILDTVQLLSPSIQNTGLICYPLVSVYSTEIATS